MSAYAVTYRTQIEVIVTLDEDDEDVAADASWEIVNGYLNTLGTQTGDERITYVCASLDGIGADEVREVTS